MKQRDGSNILHRLRNEIAIMSYLAGHPNIVQLQVRRPGRRAHAYLWVAARTCIHDV